MKSVTPTILSFDALYEEFENGIQYRPALLKGQFNRSLNPERQRILNTLRKHKAALDEIEEVTLDLIHKSILNKPPVYITKTKDAKTGIDYFNARTVIPIKGGKKKEIKIYVGKAIEFNNDTKSDEARLRAERIMKETLIRKAEEGEFQ